MRNNLMSAFEDDYDVQPAEMHRHLCSKTTRGEMTTLIDRLSALWHIDTHKSCGSAVANQR